MSLWKICSGYFSIYEYGTLYAELIGIYGIDKFGKLLKITNVQ